jgi:hypothetical protein
MSVLISYVMGRGYIDFERLYVLTRSAALLTEALHSSK